MFIAVTSQNFLSTLITIKSSLMFDFNMPYTRGKCLCLIAYALRVSYFN